MKCLNCEKELEQIEGKRAKQFCNSTCRSNFWQKMKRIANKMPKDYGEIKKLNIDLITLGVSVSKTENGAVKRISPTSKEGFKAIELTKNEQKSQNKPQEAIKKENEDKHKQHKLFKPNDPAEGSNAFYLRYGCRYYDEIEKQ